ncbi:uncharacterized protein LOC117341179 [Pecten maximus]|uniref:uncharacterized protein LOC117341179 n=1 Tax=Pecten maximus TaxID=6579 RepID=UPI001458C0E2|nr:uncharacterized protein LOC117341179 [Pecten maximus]
MCQRHSCCTVLALVFVVVFTILQCAAVVAPFWVYVFEGSYQGYFGLWQTCNEGLTDGHYLCMNVFKDGRFNMMGFYLVQAFATSGLVASLITLGVAIHQHCGNHVDVCLTVLLSVMSYITCTIVITSLVFFIRNVNEIGTVSGQTFNYIPYMSASVYASGGTVFFSMLSGSIFIIVAYSASKGSGYDGSQDGGRQDAQVQEQEGRIANRRFRSNKIFDYKYYF